MDRDNEGIGTDFIPVFGGTKWNFSSKIAGRDKNLPDGIYEFVRDVSPNE